MRNFAHGTLAAEPSGNLKGSLKGNLKEPCGTHSQLATRNPQLATSSAELGGADFSHQFFKKSKYPKGQALYGEISKTPVWGPRAGIIINIIIIIIISFYYYSIIAIIIIIITTSIIIIIVHKIYLKYD